MSWTLSEARQDNSWPVPVTDKARFLVIEDEEDVRESMRLVLSLEGHEAQTASSGAEGLRKLEEDCNPPDVVLIDIRMPGMNGYEVAQRVRDLPHGVMIKLIAVTAYGSPRERARAIAAGFDAHLTKPCTYSDLIHTIHQLDSH